MSDRSDPAHERSVSPEVDWYCRERLRLETEGVLGGQAHVVREIRGTSATIANIIGGQRKTGHDYARRLAIYWGLTTDQLEAAARLAHAVGRVDLEVERRRSGLLARTIPFREQPGWAEARAEVERRWPTVPARLIDAVGDYVLPGIRVSAWWIRSQARLLEDAEAAEERGEPSDATGPHRQALASAAAERPQAKTGQQRRVAPASSTPPPRTPAAKGRRGA